MPRRLQLAWVDQDGTKREFSLDFTDDEWRIVERFTQFADELESLRCVGDGGLDVSVTMKWDAETEELLMEPVLPPRENVAALVHHLRPFILTGEQTFFLRIYNVLARQIEQEPIRSALNRVREQFMGKISIGGWKKTAVASTMRRLCISFSMPSSITAMRKSGSCF
jgi:hypothetical protein